MVHDSHQQIVQQWCQAMPVTVPRASTSRPSPISLSHIYLQPTPHPPAAHMFGHLCWKPPLNHPHPHNPMPSNIPALVSKYNAYSSVLTSDLIIDFKENIEKGFLHFIFCCWIEKTSPDFYPLISMNNGKLHIGWNSRLSPKVRPKSKPNSPKHFWRLYSDPGGMISHLP